MNYSILIGYKGNSMKIIGIRYRFILAILILPFVFSMITMLSSRMEVRHVYNILPVFIGSNSSILTGGSAAMQRGVFIFITPSQFDDEEIIQHELIHVKRYYRTLSFSCWASLFSQKYLADVEAEAYMLMAKSPKDFDWIAKMIKEEYAPNVDKEYIINCLETHWASRR